VSATTPISAIVLAKNEEALIGRCLDSLAFLDEVVVVDSGSRDRTREIAAERGAKVVEQEWLGWSAQRRVGIEAARHDWVFVVEADEVVPPHLRMSVERVAKASTPPEDVFSVDRRNDFLGVLLPNEARPRNIQTFVRLFHRRHSHYDPDMRVHERVVYTGRARVLDGILVHWRAGDLDDQVDRLNSYATAEADMLDDHQVAPRAWKIVVMPLARFGWLYLIKREYRFGVRGVIHAQLRAFADFTRYAKHWERHRVSRVADPPPDLLTSPPSAPSGNPHR